MLHLVLVFMSFFLAGVQAKFQKESQEVYFSVIVSRGENGYNSSGALPAIRIALEEIEHHQLLPDYNLTYITARNSKVSTEENRINTTYHFFKHRSSSVFSFISVQTQ